MSATASALRALAGHPQFRRGASDMLAVAPGIFTWGVVTGVAMVNSGLTVPLALFMSLVVFAGSAQLAALPLIAAGAPMWVVWTAAACVNLRFVIFSAQLRPYWIHLPRRRRALLAYFTADLAYAMFVRRFPEPEPGPGQLEYSTGSIAVNWPSWQIGSVLGVLAAKDIPAHWGLGFAGTMSLLGLTCSLLAGRATWIAAAVSASAAVAAYALPLKLNIVVAIAAAVAVGLALDPGPTPAARAAGGRG